MFETSGIIGKLIVFILLTTAPVAIIAFWLVTQELLPWHYAVLLTLTPIAPAVLVYNRLIKDMDVLSRRFERETVESFLSGELPDSPPSALLPTKDPLLAMGQYRRALQRLFTDAKSQQNDAMLLFDMLPDPVLVLEDKRQISRSNKAARTFFDVSDMDADLTTFLRHPALLNAVDRSLRGENEGPPIAFTIPGTVPRHVAAHVVNLQNDQQTAPRIILTLHDLTAARKTEQMRVDFIANASHELRTPLAILIGAVETLQGPAASDVKAQGQFLSMMQDQSQRMSRLIDDLLSLSQIEMNEHTQPSDPVNVNDILQNVVDLMSSKAADLKMPLELDVPEGKLVAAGDINQLSQVFINLVDNALKYGRENTPVVISLTAEMGEARISIIDQGEGIAAEYLPRLTERFYRVDSDRSRKIGGTGLGLAIVKHIVSRHRGQLDIQSVIGTGSHFTVRLPINSGAGI